MPEPIPVDDEPFHEQVGALLQPVDPLGRRYQAIEYLAHGDRSTVKEVQGTWCSWLVDLGHGYVSVESAYIPEQSLEIKPFARYAPTIALSDPALVADGIRSRLSGLGDPRRTIVAIWASQVDGSEFGPGFAVGAAHRHTGRIAGSEREFSETDSASTGVSDDELGSAALIDRLAKELNRVTSNLENFAAHHPDPGSEAMGAIYCARQALGLLTAPSTGGGYWHYKTISAAAGMPTEPAVTDVQQPAGYRVRDGADSWVDGNPGPAGWRYVDDAAYATLFTTAEEAIAMLCLIYHEEVHDYGDIVIVPAGLGWTAGAETHR